MSVHTSSRRERDAVRIFSEKLRSSHDKARRVALRARTPRCLTMWVDGMRAQRALLIPGHDRDRLAEGKVCLQRVASCCNPLIVKNRTCGLLALEPQRRDSCSRDEVKPPASVRPGDSRGKKMRPPHAPTSSHRRSIGRFLGEGFVMWFWKVIETLAPGLLCDSACKAVPGCQSVTRGNQISVCPL